MRGDLSTFLSRRLSRNAQGFEAGQIGLLWAEVPERIWGTFFRQWKPGSRFRFCLVGGVESAKKLPEVDEINFAPRVKVPTLMVNGRYDHFFPLETSQRVALPQDAGFGEGRDLRRPPCAIQSFLMASYSAID